MDPPAGSGSRYRGQDTDAVLPRVSEGEGEKTAKWPATRELVVAALELGHGRTLVMKTTDV